MKKFKINEVGTYKKGKFKGKKDGKDTREYSLWYRVLRRVYSEKSLELYPTYKGCRVDERWLDFQCFAEDVTNKIGFNNKDVRYWELDKDLLGDGKTYSNETCVFLPQEINVFLANKLKKESNLPAGIDLRSDGRYRARIGTGRNRVHLGYFKNLEDAVKEYAKAREFKARELAEKYKNRIDEKAYNKLLNYKEENYGKTTD